MFKRFKANQRKRLILDFRFLRLPRLARFVALSLSRPR